LTRTELLARAADAASRAGFLARAVDLATVAISEVDASTDPVAAGLLHERRAWFLWRVGHSEQALDEYRQAVSLVPPAPPSTARARVLAAYADALERRGSSADARDRASEAIAVAVAVGAALEEGHAHHALGLALGALGDPEGGVAELDRARQLAERNGDVADVAGTYVHLWRMLTEQGRPNEMVDLAIEAAEFCKAADMEVAGLLLDCLAAAFLHQLGRWDAAEARLAVDGHHLWGLPAVVTDIVHGLIDIDRGAIASAGERLEAARCLGAQIYDGRINGLLYRGLAELAVWEGRYEDALTAVTTGLGLTGDDEMRARLCALGLRAAADRADERRAEAGTASPPDEVSELLTAVRELDARALARQAPEVSEVRAATATAVAEESRLAGRSDPEQWCEAVRRWHELGFPAPAAYCRWRLAAAVLAEGRRSDAVELWQRAHTAAAGIGAEPLRLAIEADAARAAVPLAPAGGSESGDVVPFGLTARELEVLTLVAAGRTNREIGQALLISEKTASVHVSRILAKLGARSRAQAAGIAGQIGLAGSGGRPAGE
jgi:DNA-binding CsgD family transcriptional regulator